MNIKTELERPDRLMAGVDHLFDPGSKRWEPVKQAYWSEEGQCYVVYLGVLPDAGPMHIYGAGARVWTQRYYQ